MNDETALSITELEKRCPGCSFYVTSDPPEVHITEYNRKFTVDLSTLGETAEEWFEKEIERHPTDKTPSLQPDGKYRVLCPRCGPIIIGYGAFFDQMRRPDTSWFCKQCGEPAEFDSENYESYSALERE